MSEQWDENKYEGFSKRLGLLGLLFALGMLILIFRLWFLQIIHGENYALDSKDNSLRPQRLMAPRGMIYGRSGLTDEVILADNRAALDLKFVLADCNIEPEKVANHLENLLQIDRASFLNEVESARKANQPHRQLLIKPDIPRSVSARIEEMSPFLPGVFTVARPVRRYVYGKTGGQILGYVGEISSNELKRSKENESKHDRYSMGDLIGRRGVEKIHESTLHGLDGEMLVTKYARGKPQLRTDPYGNVYVELDSFGHQLVLENTVEAQSGDSIQLTLDIRLQEKCEDLLKGVEGSIVVLNADNGEVLALASAPGYDPSVFVSIQGNQERKEILTSKPNRMLNRSYQEVYPTGSTFKVLMAAMALEEGIIDKDTTFFCPGLFRLPRVSKPWYCWKHSGHGSVNVVDALAFSCDVFFYNVGQRAGVEKIKEWSTKFGWGVKTGIDLPGEEPGIIPSLEWKKEFARRLHPNDPTEWNWFPGETINLSIGQGYLTATPLQSAVMMAAIMNGGRRVIPYINANAPKSPGKPFLKQQTLNIITEGLRKCVEKKAPAPTGTGKLSAIEGYAILGKTGTAQLVSRELQKGYTDETIPKHLRDHAWFVCGVIDRDPKIAICILIERGHHGSSVAAPLGKEIIQFYYESLEEDKVLQLAKSDSAEEAP